MEFKKIKDIAKINPENISKTYDKKYIMYLDTSNITNGKIDEIVKVSINNAPSRAKRIVKENDIIYSTVRPNLCHYGILRDVIDNMIVSTGFCVIRCDIQKAIPEYVYAYLTLPTVTEKLHAIAETSTSAYPSIRPSDIENVVIPVPNMLTQKRISKILSHIEKKIELNNLINDNLQKFINNLFIKYFVKFDIYNGKYKETALGMIPETFNVDILDNIVSFSNGYGWDSKIMADSYIDNSYKVFKMGNINIGGGINKSKTKSWILKDNVVNLEQYISKKGDILMCMTDMKNSGNPLLGHTALIDKNGEFVINQRVGILRCDKKIGYSYIYTMSNMPYFINEIRSRANSGVQVNLTTKGICDTLVLIPDNNTLTRFEDVAIPLYEQIFNNNNENESLEKLRDTLLPKLMNGEIDLEKINLEEI